LAGGLFIVVVALGLTVLWLGRGRLTLKRHFGRRAKAVFEGRAMELSVAMDGSNRWFQLDAVERIVPSAAEGSGKEPGRWRIFSVMNDPLPARPLGAWLSRSAGAPLVDRFR
jgi:hypothetical protein